MNLEDRVKRRAIIEDPEIEHALDVGDELDARLAYKYAPNESLGQIFRLEAEDTANPIAATAVVRKPLTLTLDEDAFREATS